MALGSDAERPWWDEPDLETLHAESRRRGEEIHERKLAQLEEAVANGDIERAATLRRRMVTIPPEVPLGQERHYEARQERDIAEEWLRDAIRDRDEAEERLREVTDERVAAEERLRGAICDTSAVFDETGRRVRHDEVVRMQVGFALDPPARTNARRPGLLRTLGGLIGILILLGFAANLADLAGIVQLPEPVYLIDEWNVDFR